MSRRRGPDPRSGLAELDEALGFLGGRLEQDLPLAPLCTYRVGGTARRFVEVTDPDELAALARVLAAAGHGLPVLVVGRGSNLLVTDEGFDGLVVRLGERFTDVEVDHRVVHAGGAASLPVVARRSVAEGLSGFEWAVGVPGSVGGAVAMNAGGHGSDMAAVLGRVRVTDLRTGETRQVAGSDLELAYRSSAIGADQVVTSAELVLAPGDRDRGEALLGEIVRWRREHQPGGHNAGSVFTNPHGRSAGALIDAAGCRGMRLGSAAVSDKHANFIQADENGTAADVYRLMVEVARRVREHSGIELRAETRLVGFPPLREVLR